MFGCLQVMLQVAAYITAIKVVATYITVFSAWKLQVVIRVAKKFKY